MQTSFNVYIEISELTLQPRLGLFRMTMNNIHARSHIVQRQRRRFIFTVRIINLRTDHYESRYGRIVERISNIDAMAAIRVPRPPGRR